ncbi:MAG: phenylalanine--tRNA ligase subunit beta [Candidatus Dojkabacteria bacterium]
MKVLFSQLQKYLPDLKATPDEVGKVFTMIGYMQDGDFEIINFDGKEDYFIDLEVRQNRADCFSVQGLARELSAYYNIPLVLPLQQVLNERREGENNLPIQIKNPEKVKRVMAVKMKIKDLKRTPVLIKKYLDLYKINTVNTIVDLTNYVMLETGHPSHAFDAGISGDNLTWELNPGYKKMTSLDGTEIDLTDDALIISNGQAPLALAGIVGGKIAAMTEESEFVIIEMAVYDGGLIRKNSRGMKVMTEASSRLEKFMDPESVEESFGYLINLIKQHCDVEIISPVFEKYPGKEEKNVITVDLDKVSELAGMEISHKESFDYLSRLGFEFITLPVNLQDDQDEKLENATVDSGTSGIIQVKRPINRLDIEQEEDVVEEIIRMKGYDKVPTEIVNNYYTKDVTPTYITLIEEITTQLVSQGWDEVLSLTLVDETKNAQAYYGDTEAIRVENTINEEFPILRQSVAVSIFGQIEQLKKQMVPDINIFEIGKVFGKRNGLIEEYYSLGIARGDSDLNKLQISVESVLRKSGLNYVKYEKSENTPQTAHRNSFYKILVYSNASWIEIGHLYISNKFLVPEVSFAELNVSLLDELTKNLSNNDTVALTQKLVSLDTNFTEKSKQELVEEISEKLARISESVWKWEIVDEFEEGDMTKYTVRVYYVGLGDQEAKELNDKLVSY